MLGETYALDNAARSRARSLVQRRAPAVAADGPTPPSRDQAAGGSPGPRPPVPDGADPPGGVDRPLDRHPGPGPRRAAPLAPHPDPPARIYFKDESVSPAGSHKPNTAAPQAYYNREEGIKRIATETGAGQWGSALAFSCSLFGLTCKVYMVWASYQQKPYRRLMIETWGGEVVPSPVDQPDSPGSLGMAISDAVRDAGSREDTHYSLGSVLNHVLLHQTVIGLEAKEQLQLAGEEKPDLVIGCCGGGSNLGGLALPFVADEGVELLAVEPTSCATLTTGKFEYDFGDTAGLTPLLSMYTLGHEFVPPPIHAGGLRYHGDAPIISNLVV